jgi:predicted nucleic acid-binding protein
MAAKTECYVDTSALIAFLDASDSYHPAFKRYFANPPRLVSSALVIAEGHAWFLRRYDRRRAQRFLDLIDALPKPLFVPFDNIELGKVELVVRRYADQNLTLADAHGLAIIAQRKISVCWSTDRHMALGGARLAV